MLTPTRAPPRAVTTALLRPLLYRTHHQTPTHLPLSQHLKQHTPTPTPTTRPYSQATAQAPVLKTSTLPAPHTGTIRILSLNRPAARNAISRQLLAELAREVQGLHDEAAAAASEEGGRPAKTATRALILASEVDASFCAGADLKERAGFSPEETTAFLTTLRATLTSLSTLPLPTITALAGPAFGGGLELALTTHFRVFASTAQVGLPETRLGIIPGAGGTYRLPALIGLARARDLILTGRRVGGPEAYFLGLCDRLVQVLPDEAAVEGRAREMVLAEAVRLAREVCEGAPVAIRAAMRAVEGCAGGEVVENEAYRWVVGTRDRDEALAAFREKRRPVFEGR